MSADQDSPFYRSRGEFILDAGCGTGVFTSDFLEAETKVVGLEQSRPMLSRAMVKNRGRRLIPVQGDMRKLPFAGTAFDKAVSVTAIEFIEEAKAAVEEMFRVTKPGGIIVIATLSSLSPWAHLAFFTYKILDYFLARTKDCRLTGAAVARIALLSGIVVTGILRVIKNLPDVSFSPGFTLFFDIAHLGFMMTYLLCALAFFILKAGWRPDSPSGELEKGPSFST